MTDISRVIYNPFGTTIPDGVNLNAVVAGRSGEAITSDAHAPYYNMAVRGVLFFGTTVTAGTTIPVMATNLVSTFTLSNPAGSGKNLILLRYNLAHTTATTVVGDVSLYYQIGVGGATTAPASTTALVAKNAFLGGGAASAANLYSAATLTGALGTTGSGNIAKGPTLVTFGAVTTTDNLPVDYDFKGGIILPPGTLVTTAGNAAQTAAMNQTFWWAEVPA